MSDISGYTPRLEHGEQHLPDTGAGLAPAERILALWAPYATQGAKPKGVDRTRVAHARIDYGRWIADCPYGCGGAQVPPWTDRRFFCINCANGGTGKWCPLEWPDAADVETAETLMQYRPPRGHFFDPRIETVSDLAVENTFQGYASDLPEHLEARLTRVPIVRGPIRHVPADDADHDDRPGTVDDKRLAAALIAGTAHMLPFNAGDVTGARRDPADTIDLSMFEAGATASGPPAARAAALNRVSKARNAK